METYYIFKDLAIIIVAAKLLGILARKYKAPQVVGEIIAGLLIGPSVLGLVQQSDFLVQIAEVGVVLLMFSAGLETDLKELLKTGPIAFLIACAGVLVPLIGGTLLHMGFYGASPWGSENFYKAVFIGVIMTATSVSITVESLKEMGRLKGKVGATLLSAAIIDDVIGIIVLTFVIGFKNPNSHPGQVVLSTLLFFVAVFTVGSAVYRAFKKLDERYPHTHRISILGLALCFFFSYAAERYFGIADITGAYVAGVALCSIQDSYYIEKKIGISSYLIFGPIFFASIGFKTSVDHLNAEILLFSAGFVIVALITKIIGCGMMAKICRFSFTDSLKIGVGMMARGEVALIVAQKGLSVDLLTPEYFTAVILLIIASSISTPILLKLLYARDAQRSSHT
ncbi:MAG: cation:proton antiporter [Lachnospiraceae bacterium]|nr:cation:proton antiporter [Lachnospiraceae bacterium]MCI9546384.1 cation:proton antiporter [Lachnospiraceae bacterium]